MYLQVTTKCNMACAHCMFACRPGRGEHMPMETFRKALDVAAEYDSVIAIGGGEPTLHPDILAFLGIASFLSTDAVFMVTNGTCPERLWRTLMDARKRDRLSLHVSRDPWHDADKLKPWVEGDADSYGLWWGKNRGESRTIVLRGRARRNRARIERDCRQRGLAPVFVDSDCMEPRVSPDGRVWADVPGGGATGQVDDPMAVSKAWDLIREWEDREWERGRNP